MSAVRVAPDTPTPPAPLTPDLQPELVDELADGPWNFPWRLAPGITVRVADPGARHAAWTLEAMLEQPARNALAMGGDERAALDLACGEGRLAQRLLEWHATYVAGVEGHQRRLRRARLLQRHFAIPESKLELRAASELKRVAATSQGGFEVVLITGVREGVDDIDYLAGVAGACARTLCLVEAARDHQARLSAALRGAGFSEVVRVPAPADGERRYVLGERAVLAARRGTAP